jgi:drug/metabolite transporter (DMT)-like permease
MSPTQIGELAALGTAFCWTISPLCFASAGRLVGSMPVNVIRLVIAWGFLMAHGAIFRGLPLPTDAPGETWLWLGISGFVGFFLGDLCLFRALVLLGPRITTLLMSLAPPFAAILGYPILGERLTAQSWIGMAVTLAGVAWVARERNAGASGATAHASPVGILLGVLAALGQAAGAVFAKIGMGHYDPFACTQIRVLPALVSFGLLFLALGRYDRILAALRTPRAMSRTALGAFFGPFLGVALFLISLDRIAAGVAQTIAALVPVIMLPSVIVLHRERVSWRAAIGACVAVAGVAILVSGG